MERDGINIKPDGYKWVITAISGGLRDNDFYGGVFTDMKYAAECIGVSESTFRRRMNGSIKEGFEINGFEIIKMPYYKSKRGSFETMKGLTNQTNQDETSTVLNVSQNIPDLF
jgi:hypothetical protein